MGLLSAIATLPLAPARVAGWTIRRVVDEAERQYYDPDAIRRQLAELSRRLDEGELTEEEFDRLEDELLDRLEEGQARRAAGGTG
ncbi:gas vesicle protein GvpG [Marinitenerispora sediminis]|uniref:Gas vesicle protein n=1 Tax=Marinitenerispora sediminis TaxID=1931232 RepID=A0A368T2D1_9ACTN|nr:gas vesicle protein GvpG [Marinitenerispora sediminis]RCV47939.1 gas vesicle protein [Marinitenerispora sediminis]RCV51895.1 gas vesicle protein [Marinitenerispora sediminis]RCV55652.1 gas vesicle protein [Marinitenerispora sediminis]